jgi:hydrogenase-4 component B
MATLAYALATAVGLAATVTGVAGLVGPPRLVRLPWLLPLGGVELALDPLSSLFVALTGAVSLPASLYGVVWERRRGAAYVAFVTSMCLVPLAANTVTFLIVWELMSLASYALVLGAAETRESVRAAWVYAVMTHAGLACLLAAMLLLGAATGSLSFDAWRGGGAALAPTTRNIAFALLALGFASKAGAIPLHVWLPLAHPAAPSHVSALMSGVMIKLGIYGLLRASLDWLGTGPPWWGVVVLLAGAVSAVVGVLYALIEHDLKRLLAFHSIENIGIILIGLGAGMLFLAAGLQGVAMLGVVAALYHTVNHAVFKSLLFLGAGAVTHTVGTRDMEQMGGLVKRMPWTAACFLVGCIAIAGLPPLNGFVSEWLTFQALLQSVRIPRPALNLVFVLGMAGLALTGGLAMAAFVKAFGITFLALPRSDAAARAHEAPAAVRVAMLALALACVILGLGATLIVPALAAVAGPLVRTHESPAVGEWLTLRVPGEFATLSPITIALALAAALAATLTALRVTGAARHRRSYETWGCGRLRQTPRMEYTATAFANPFKRIFNFFYRPVRQLEVDAHPQSRFFVRRMHYDNPTRPIFEDWLYRPALSGLRLATRRVQTIQSGNANLYLVYILAALLLMLVFA